MYIYFHLGSKVYSGSALVVPDKVGGVVRNWRLNTGYPCALFECGNGTPLAIPATFHPHRCISLAIEGTHKLFSQPAFVLHMGPISVCDIAGGKVIGKRLPSGQAG